MKLWLVRLGVVCALGSLGLVFAAESAEAKASRAQVLIEFVVLEISGAGAQPLALPTGEELSSSAPNESGGFSYAVKITSNLESTMAALTRDARVKVLQRPRIQTSHDTPATLFIGEIARKKPLDTDGKPQMIGLTLAVTPLIDSNGLITMDLRMKQVSRDGRVWTKAGLVPITSTREAEAKLALHDRETILMGGLMTPARQTSAPPLRSPKDPAGASTQPNSSLSGQTVLLLRPTLLRN